jgi:phage terminase small subunit
MSKKPVKKTPAKKKAAPKKKGVGEAVAKCVADMSKDKECTVSDPLSVTAEVREAWSNAPQQGKIKITPVDSLTAMESEAIMITEIQHHRDGNGVDVLFDAEQFKANAVRTDPAPGVAMDGFSYLERMFIYCYTTNNGNGTQAAKDAGYQAIKDNTFASIAYENLRKPHIKKEIERIMTEKVMGKEEVLSRISHMARANLNDYLRVVKKPVRPMVKTSLRVLIAETNAKIEDQQKFIDRLAERKARDTKLVALRDEITIWQEQVIRWEIALERDPFAVEEREGPEQLEEVIELDLVKLAQDKEKGLIKSLKPAKGGGWEVELYGADGSLVNIGRYHGIFEKDNRLLNVNTVPLTMEEAKNINDALESKF